MKRNLFVKAILLAGLTFSFTSGMNLRAQELDYEALSDASITEFLNLAKNPRLGFHLEKVKTYLMGWAETHGFEPHTDYVGNVWFDVPATQGCENYPKIIMQGHMDMVAACKSGDEDKYDFTTMVGTPYYEGEGDDLLLKGAPINLGADDGAGVGMLLAIANPENKVKHGPLRMLITANEDFDMSGAEFVDASVLDGKYLINNDDELVGEVVIGCSGGCDEEYIKSYSGADVVLSNYKKVTLSVNGLRGGHSGDDIWDTSRLSAATVLKDIVTNYLTKYDCYLESIECGMYDNAIANSLKMTFAVTANSAETIQNELSKLLSDYQDNYSEEVISKEITVSDWTNDAVCYDKIVITTLKDFFAEIPQGIIEQNNATGRVTKSNNIGKIQFVNGALDILCLFRSDYNEWLDSEEQYFKDVAEKIGLDVVGVSSYPAWLADYGSSLAKWATKYYEDAGQETEYCVSIGALENTFFCKKNPNMQSISVGPTVDRVHTIDEALHVSTVPTTLKVITSLLANAENLDNDPTSIMEVNTDATSQNKTRKFIQDGSIYVNRNGKLYNVAGVRVK